MGAVVIICILLAIPAVGWYMVWDTYPRQSEEDDL